MTMAVRLKRDIVPIEEWVDSYYYLGPEAKAIFPFWRQHIINFYNKGCLEFIITGSYSVGKTYVALILMLRQLYEISCYENFPVAFGLSPSSKVMMGFISMTATKAKSTGIKKLIRMFDAIPYFQDIEPRNTDVESSLDMGYVEVVHGSNLGHLTGEDFYGVIFDEANFVIAAEGDEFDKAKKIYLESRIRGKSRFSINGIQYGFFGLLSSADQTTSFTETHIRESREDDEVHIIEAATYDVKPGAYSPTKFKVFTGMDDIPPFIVDDVGEDRKNEIGKVYGQTIDTFLTANHSLVIEVPDDLKKFYREDIVYSLKALSGRTVAGSSKLLRNPALLSQAYEKSGLVMPLSTPTISLSLFDDDVFTDFIDPEKLRSNYEEGCKLYFHFDLSKSGDTTGFAAAYKSMETGRFRVPLRVRVTKRKSSDEIDYAKLEEMLYYVVETLEASAGFISSDQYAHQYIGQNFKKRFGKEKVDVVSADKDDSHYLLFLFLLKKRIIDLYEEPAFTKNFLLLEHDRGANKVDHPQNGTKDEQDATVVAVSNCFRLEGMTREEVIANQFLQGSAGFYEETEDLFYKQLMDGARNAGEDSFYGDIMRNLG